MILFLVSLLSVAHADMPVAYCALPKSQMKSKKELEQSAAAGELLKKCKKEQQIAIVTHEPDTDEGYKVECIEFTENQILTKSMELDDATMKRLAAKNLVSVYNYTGATMIASKNKAPKAKALADECAKKTARTISGTNDDRPCENFGKTGFIALTTVLKYLYFGQPYGGCLDVMKNEGITAQASTSDNQIKPQSQNPIELQPPKGNKNTSGTAR